MVLDVAGRSDLVQRIAHALRAPVVSEVAEFARRLAADGDALGVLFYGSNLRSGALDGVLDFYVLTEGPREKGLWPRVSYHELAIDGTTLRAKVATMRLATFAHAAAGRHLDTTIWTRFVQPCALIFAADDSVRRRVTDAIADATTTAARFAAALGPGEGSEEDFWAALFRATYRAELRVEKAGRERQILAFGAAHFAGLLALAWRAGNIDYAERGEMLAPRIPPAERDRILKSWSRRRRAGKPLNVLRLLRAATTFEGGARYLAWKVERHTGIPVPLGPVRERHPLLAAPAIVAAYLRARRAAKE